MKQSLIIGIVVVIQIIATLLTQLIVIRMVGIGHATDAYIAAQALPLVVFGIISTALQSVWLPKLAVLNTNVYEWRKQQSIAQSQALILGVAVCVFIWPTRDIWAKLFFPGFIFNQLELINLLIGPLLIAAVFNTQSSLLIIALRARSRFLVGEFISTLGTLLSLLLIIKIVGDYGVEGVAWVAVLRATLVYSILYGIAEWPKIKFDSEIIQSDTWKKMSPILFGASIYKTSPLVDRYWASQGLLGSVTILSLAQYAITAIATVIERTICMPILPNFSRYVRLNEYRLLKKTYRDGLKKITIVVLMFLTLVLISYPYLNSFLQLTLKVSPERAKDTLVIMILLFGSLHVAVSGSLAVACFYAMNDTKTPVAIGLKGFLLGFILKGVGFLTYGLPGLAIGTSVYFLFNIIMFDFGICKKIKKELIKDEIRRLRA